MIYAEVLLYSLIFTGDYLIRLSLDEATFSQPFVTTLYPSAKRLLRSKYNIVDVSTGNSLEDISLVSNMINIRDVLVGI